MTHPPTGFYHDSSFPASAKPSPDWWSLCCPREAWVLIALLVVMAPLILLTGESLLFPLVEEIQAIGQGIEPSMSWDYLLKIVVFALIAWLGLGQLIYRLEVLYTTAWSRPLSRPHLLHVDYAPDTRDSMKALLGWTTYRNVRLMAPPIVLSLSTLAVGWLEFTLFNSVMASPVFSMPLPFILGLFVFLLLGLFAVLSIFQSGWHALLTAYGSCIVITEPQLSYAAAFDRSMRLGWVTRRLWLLLLGYMVGWLLLLAYISTLLIVYDVEQLIQFKANWPLIIGGGLILVGWTIALTSYKFFAYHRALQTYYRRLPAAIQAQFTPPPATRLSFQ